MQHVFVRQTLCPDLNNEVMGSLAENKKAFFTEDSPFAPNSPYAASKAAAEHLVRATHHTFGLDTVITRCGNNYGPRQFPEKFVPLVIANALLDKSIPVYGDGLNVRDWIYVEDHCRAIQLVMEQGQPGAIYNIERATSAQTWKSFELYSALAQASVVDTVR
jgi:dTDP-glucose 4,6-dehydratase